MAAQYSFDAQKGSFDGTVHGNGVDGILRAGRIKTARRRKEEWRKAGLVQSNEKDQYRRRCFSEHSLSAGVPLEELSQFLTGFQIGERRHIFFGHDHSVMVLGEQILVKTEKLPDQTFDPVSFNRVPRFFRHGDAQACVPERIAAGNDCKEF